MNGRAVSSKAWPASSSEPGAWYPLDRSAQGLGVSWVLSVSLVCSLGRSKGLDCLKLSKGLTSDPAGSQGVRAGRPRRRALRRGRQGDGLRCSSMATWWELGELGAAVDLVGFRPGPRAWPATWRPSSPAWPNPRRPSSPAGLARRPTYWPGRLVRELGRGAGGLAVGDRQARAREVRSGERPPAARGDSSHTAPQQTSKKSHRKPTTLSLNVNLVPSSHRRRRSHSLWKASTHMGGEGNKSHICN